MGFVWVATVFTKNRDRLLKQSMAESFFQRVLKVAQPYLSDEHFTVDGTPSCTAKVPAARRA